MELPRLPEAPSPASPAGAPAENAGGMPSLIGIGVAPAGRRQAEIEAIGRITERLTDKPHDTAEAKLQILAATALNFGKACCVARNGSPQGAHDIMREAIDLLIEGGLWFDEIDELHAACRLLIDRHAVSGDFELCDAL